VRVRARGIELASLARYLPIQGRLAGVGTADVRVVASEEKTFGLTVTGDASVDRLALGDDSRTLVGAARVAATGLAYTWPARAAVAQLTVTQPAAALERDAAGVIGLFALLRPPEEPAGSDASPAAKPSTASAPIPDVRIAHLKIDGGRARLSDAASASRVDVKGLAVSARNVTWPGSGAADLELSASVAGAAISARGTVDAATRRAEIALGVGGADLAHLQPWLPITGRLRGALSRADLRVTASHEGTLALTVAGDATLERLTLSAGAKTPVGVSRVTAKGIDYRWPATVRVADLTLTQPSVAIERDAAGTLDLMTLTRPATADRAGATTAGEAAPPAAADVTITRLRIDDGRANAADATTGGAAQVTRLAFTGEDVSWPARGVARVRLTADVAGGQVTARGTVDGAQQRGEIVITLRGADLTALQPWLPIVGRVNGAADADVTASVGLAPFTLALRGSLGVANLAFLDGTRPLLTVARVDAAGVDLQWPASLAIDRLRVNTPWALVERNLQGELSLRALFGRRPDRPAPPTTEPVAAGPVPGLELSVHEALFDNGGLNIVDDAVEPAARFELRGSRLELRNLTWPARGPAAVQLSAPMPGSGTLKARGTLSIEPTRLQLEAELDQVDLGPGRPYLPFDARLNGKVSGRAKISGTFGDAIALVVDGDATVDRLALGDADRRLATAQRAELTGLRYQYPTSVRIRQVMLRKPWALIERNTDGSLELLSLFTRRRQPPPSASGTGTGTAPAATPAPAARVRVAINKLSLDDGFLRFVDRTTDPDYAEELSDILLTAEGLGTSPRRRGSLDLRGRLASGNALTVRGQVGGLTGPRFLDLTVDVKEFPVPRLNPYLDRLSTWVARQGTLTASLRYRLDDDDLQASNAIGLNGLELEEGGRGTEVQRQVGLPLGLLVSLLKDRQGNITLDIPVRGRLSAPDFDYSQAMWTAVRNLAIKLVSLPFSWVGNMFYTADARIGAVQVFPVPFEIARTAPTSFGRDQLQRLATFLREQPAIRLRLRPVTTVADVTALRREALHARLSERGTDAAARRQAAVAIYAELFPRRQPPASDEALFDELVRETPPPPRALRALATERTAAVRDELVGGGVAADRLEPAESRAAVESEGDGRVEFEIAR